jgi:hypothetical protein
MKILANTRGFTLVETVFSTLLLPLLFFSLYTVVDMANVIYNTNTIFAGLNQNTMQILRSIAREAGQTSPLVDPAHLTITADGGGNSILTFQIPVDWDNDGDVVSGTLNPQTEWGAYSDTATFTDGVLNGWVRYQIDDENRLVRQLLDENEILVDGSQRVIANNVETFTAVRTQDVLDMSLSLTAQDSIGRHGQAQDYEWSFSSSTYLRNAVN